MSRAKKLFFSIFALAALLSPIVFSDVASAGYGQPSNYTAAVGELRARCNAHGRAVAFAAYASNQSLNMNTGRWSYNVNIVWERCNSVNTVAYAVIGVPNICPYAGNYGVNGNPAYDCVKYIGNPRWSGYSQLDCPGGRTNDACVSSDFWSRGVGISQNQPSGRQTLSIPLSGTIPNWNTRKQTTGNYSIGGNDALCQFYKNTNNTVVGNHGCQNFRVQFSWTANWNATPSTTVNRTTAAPGQVITWTHRVVKGGNANTNRSIGITRVNSQGLGTGAAALTPISAGWTGNPDAVRTSTYTVTNADLGQTLCRATRIGPQSSTNTASLSSSAACVTVPINWTISSSVTPTSGTGNRLAPGQTVAYDWYVRNNGPTSTTRQVNYVVKVVRYSNGSATTPPSNAQLAGATALTNTSGAARQWSSNRASGWAAGASNQAARTNDALLRYTLTQSDVQRWVCAVVYASPSAHNNTNRVYDSTCRYIPIDFDLTPRITNINDNSILDIAETSFEVEGEITNTGSTRSATNTDWQMIQLVYGPTATINDTNGGTGTAAPCAYFTGETSCSNPAIGNGTDAAAYAANETRDKSGTATVTPDTYELGTRVCFVLSVRPHTNGSTNWRYSPMVCQIVGKRPNVQVRGGDLLVGRGLDSDGNQIRSNISTSVTAARVNGTTRNFGSWSEYGILASGGVTRMASGSGYAGGAGTQSLCNGLSLLSFYNRTASGACSNSQIGRYEIASSSPAAAIAAKFTPNGGNVAGTINLSNVASGQVRPASGNVTINSTGDIPVGKWLVIHAPGRTVTINNNITYSNAPIPSAAQIPQVVIIAQNIYIAPTVTNVDAWLVASGTIRTCNQVTTASALRSTNCTEPLRVNGPVMTNRLELWRTAGAGAGAAAGEPAEVFNLRPDAYLWATAVQSGASKAQTATTRELPPRF